MKFLIAFVFLIGISYNAICQNSEDKFSRTDETVKKISLKNKRFIGYFNQSPIFLSANSLFDNSYQYFLLDERKLEIKSLEDKFILPLSRSNWEEGFLGIFTTTNNYWTYVIGYMSDDYEIYYQSLYLQYGGKNHFLDSIYNADKKVHTNFSDDGKYLLVNTLNTLSDYYNPEQDDRIAVYDLTQIQQGKIKKEYISCKHCADSHLVNDTLFFTTSKNEGYEGFYNKAIYMAPWGSLQDSVKIASHTELLAVSPDGKYILGARFFDRQKLTMVIIDVATKRYQMLLGREYYQYKPFYSYQEGKFAFNIDGFLVYIDYPKTYPFDALKWRNENIPDFTEAAFWQQFEHEPL